MEDVMEWPESPDPNTSEKNNNSVLKRFILLYEQLPELWNSASPSYSNKYKRNEALAKLLVIYKEIKRDAKVADVRKKINTLRSNCRRELNRIKASKRSGSGTDEVYKPSSWVFYALKFLHNIECPATLMEDEESQVRKTVIYHFAC